VSEPASYPPPRWPYLVGALGLILDQVTKRWFVENYALHESREVIPGFFNFTLARNTGAAFSLFDQHPAALLAVSTVIFALMVIFRDRLFSRKPMEQWAYGLIVGGVIGNLIDRTKHGYVVDFIHWFIGDLHWPIFNLADTWICTGVGLYVLSQVLEQRKAKRTATA
jgi:signal peptidase II